MLRVIVGFILVLSILPFLIFNLIHIHYGFLKQTIFISAIQSLVYLPSYIALNKLNLMRAWHFIMLGILGQIATLVAAKVTLGFPIGTPISDIGLIISLGTFHGVFFWLIAIWRNPRFKNSLKPAASEMNIDNIS